MEKNKFGLILATHSSLSKSYVEALELIMDINKSEIDAVSFEAGETVENLEEKITNLINEKYNSKDLIILSDLLGGTPSNVGVKFMKPSVKLITGINLPLVLEITMMRENNVQLKDLDINQIIQNSKNNLVYINDILSKKEA